VPAAAPFADVLPPRPQVATETLEKYDDDDDAVDEAKKGEVCHR